MKRIDQLIAIYAVFTAILVGATATLSPSNLYAYMASPIVAYFIILSHNPSLGKTRVKLVLDVLLATILLVMAAYRIYTSSPQG